MSKKKITWLDDDINRRRASANLEKRLDAKVSFVDVKSDKDALENVIKGDQPDLLIIDHNLGTIKSGIFKKGSTVATFFREKWPECPIVCVTGEKTERIDSLKKSIYEDIFDVVKLSEFDDTMIAIIDGYNDIVELKPLSVNKIILALDCPDEDESRLKSIMPNNLKLKGADSALSFNISNWVRKVLFARAGFLYNKLWASTLLGIKETSFHKVEDIFKSAKYKGIFADESNPRWWKSTLLSILSTKVPRSGLPWEKGRDLEPISKRDYSISFVSGVEFPETVAYKDETPTAEEAPMKIEETVSHPRFENLLYFEEIRMMKSPE